MPATKRQLLNTELAALQALDHMECKADPFVFISRHVEIETPKGDPIKFELWPMQVKSLDTIHQHDGTIVLKARRLGLSWVALAYALWLAIFQQGSRVLILCKNEDDAAELLDRIRRMRDRIAADPLSSHLLANLKRGPRKKRARDKVTTLDIGQSVCRALVGKAKAARSETASLLILDEFAFQKEGSGIWRGALPTIEGGGKVVAISTGNGKSGEGAEFALQWSQAVTGESGFAYLFWPWDAHPGRDAAWRELQDRLLGDPDRARVEYPGVPDDAFVSPDVSPTFSPSGIDAAERLGREYDKMLRNGTIPPPAGETLGGGIDWGEHTQGYVIWELEAGGVYIPPSEVASHQGEPTEVTGKLCKQFAAFDYWVEEVCYDAAGVQSNRTFIAESKRILGQHNRVRKAGAPNTMPVAFGKYKDECIGYLRKLFNRAAEGKDTRIIAISPKNKELLRQLRNPYIADEKEDDHGPDAVIAGVKPIAARHREGSND